MQAAKQREQSNGQDCTDLGRGGRFFDQGHTGKDHTLAGAGDVRKEPVFNRVVLGTVGWVVANANLGPVQRRAFGGLL